MKTLTNSVGMALVSVPGGTFLMGHPGKLAGPVHQVTVSGFWIGQCEVTNAQFDRFEKRLCPPKSQTDRQPAVLISWYDAVKFCQWLSRKERRHYRLPTEAEWEYAARGGLQQKDYPWGDEDPFGRAAVAMHTSMPVGSYAPNGYSLYDMAGNAQEWVADWFEQDYYAHSPRVDPQGPPMPKDPKLRGRVIRDVEYQGISVYCGLRESYGPEWRTEFTGFRVALDLPHTVGSLSVVLHRAAR